MKDVDTSDTITVNEYLLPTNGFFFDFKTSDYRGKEIGLIYSYPEIYEEGIVRYIIVFWENICFRYFYNEIAFIDTNEILDEYYYYKGERKYKEDIVEFMEAGIEINLIRYSESFESS